MIDDEWAQSRKRIDYANKLNGFLLPNLDFTRAQTPLNFDFTLFPKDCANSKGSGHEKKIGKWYPFNLLRYSIRFQKWAHSSFYH